MQSPISQVLRSTFWKKCLTSLKLPFYRVMFFYDGLSVQPRWHLSSKSSNLEWARWEVLKITDHSTPPSFLLKFWITHESWIIVEQMRFEKLIVRRNNSDCFDIWLPKYSSSWWRLQLEWKCFRWKLSPLKIETLLHYPHGKYELRIDKWINKQIEFSYKIADF